MRILLLIGGWLIAMGGCQLLESAIGKANAEITVAVICLFFGGILCGIYAGDKN